ncbi:MAG TPA: ester cyclase [Gemmatimonadaceae bacterium]|jgi:steroid delta-isomerase-like uncharacterized protein
MSPQSPVDAAKASVIAYNEKNWDRVKETVTPTVVYNEVGTHRRIAGSNEVIDAWKGWATALPDSKATFDREVASGDTVTLELTWRGTHTGPLQTPNGAIAPTGRKIEVQAVQVIDLADGKATSIRHYFDMATLLEQLGVGK